MREIVLILHDIRSAHNVGSLLRTAECLGVNKVLLTGYTPYPIEKNDVRLPHIANKTAARLHKTALGAEAYIQWEHVEDIMQAMHILDQDGFSLIALEQSPKSVDISSWMPPDKIAILLGREVEGIADNLLDRCNQIIEIPMLGRKESLNVVQAAAIILFRSRFAD